MKYLKEYNMYKGDFLLESMNESVNVKDFISKIKDYIESLDTGKIKEYYKVHRKGIKTTKNNKKSYFNRCYSVICVKS